MKDRFTLQTFVGNSDEAEFLGDDEYVGPGWYDINGTYSTRLVAEREAKMLERDGFLCRMIIRKGGTRTSGRGA